MSAAPPDAGAAATPNDTIVQSIAFEAQQMKVTLHSGQTFVRPRMKIYYTMISEQPADLEVVAGIFERMRALRAREKSDKVEEIRAASAAAREARKARLAIIPDRPSKWTELETLIDEEKKAKKKIKDAIDSYGPLLWAHQHRLFYVLKESAIANGFKLHRMSDVDDDDRYEIRKGIVRIAELSPSKFVVRSNVSPRHVYGKISSNREWVNDNLRIKTSRFAYMEKNIHQFRHFLKTGRMEGRFQQLHKACNLTADKFEHLDKFIPSLLAPDAATILNDKKTRLAIVHQALGSGPHQRGLSMTTTSKLDVTFGNAGESFKSADGVRIKVDLSRVPPDVLILNHYYLGAIIDTSGYVVPEGEQRVVKVTLPGKKKQWPYGYVDSVIKNREIYLEYLSPEWIAAIEIHAEDGDTVIDFDNKNIDHIRTAVEEHVSQTIFECGAQNALLDWTGKVEAKTPRPDVMTPSQSKAYAAGREVAASFIAGWAQADAIPAKAMKQIDADYVLTYLQMVNEAARTTDPSFKRRQISTRIVVPAKYDSRGKMVKKKKTRYDVSFAFDITEGVPSIYDMHWVGYARRCNKLVNKADLTLDDMWPKEPAAKESVDELVEDVIAPASANIPVAELVVGNVQ